MSDRGESIRVALTACHARFFGDGLGQQRCADALVELTDILALLDDLQSGTSGGSAASQEVRRSGVTSA